MSKVVSDTFHSYITSKLQFIQKIADHANKHDNMKGLEALGAITLVKPMLVDINPSIQQAAALALGRIASDSEEQAETLYSQGIIKEAYEAVKSSKHSYFKKTVCFLLMSVAKHSAISAGYVTDPDTLSFISNCVSDFDPIVKEAGSKSISQIAKHNKDLASKVIKSNVLSSLVKCLQDPTISVKIGSASALKEISKHTSDLALEVADAGTIPFLTALISHSDAKLKKVVCSCLENIAKHNVDLAEMVAEADIFPKILSCLKDPNLQVREKAACCIKELSKHTAELANIIVHYGGASALVEYINESVGIMKLPAVLSLGNIGAFDEALAMSVIAAKSILPLKECILNEENEALKCQACWAIGTIGKHSSDHAKAVAELDVPKILLEIAMNESNSKELQKKAKSALKLIIEISNHISIVEPLLKVVGMPENILKYVVGQIAKIIPNSLEAKKVLLQSEGFKIIQSIKASSGQKLKDYVDLINNQFPPEAVQFYSPDYAESLIKKMEEYNKE